MVNKNRDKIPEEMISFLKETKFDFLSDIMAPRNEECQFVQSKTLLTKFKKSLDNLMITLDKTDVHYIKCLKPNKKQDPDLFDVQFFMEQLKYNGIMDTLNLESQIFSTVIPKAEFSRRFGLRILDDLKNLLIGKMFIGRDKIYFSENSFELILKYNTAMVISSVRRIQKFWKLRTKNVMTPLRKFSNVSERQYKPSSLI
ncbi:hypothetical protein HHI36_015379 [Cryptolaemus montrouzieri]|uniref:Myosin motor domain-containing protein n=1 Tax=Cryptolaemus montrouzieri TaxID=559131 RepID=A0ABD2N6W2_9CUCU